MKIKNDNGITIVALIIAILILAIISTVALNVSYDLIDEAQLQNVKTDLLLIQSKCKIKAEQKAIGEIKEEDLYGSKEADGEYSGWYLLSQEDLNNMGVKDINAEDKYYVDYEHDDVAYGKGIVNDDKTYYKLSEILADEAK